MLRTILSAAACAALGFNLAACGNDPAGSAASGPTPQATTNSPAPASSSPAPARTTAAPAPKTAGQVAAAIKPKIRQVSRVVVWTEETDANNLLGRPGGYTSAATLVDRRAECTDPQPGVDCGDFLALLDKKNRQIVVLLNSGVTRQTEIASILGYANHTGVSKRLAQIRMAAEAYFDLS